MTSNINKRVLKDIVDGKNLRDELNIYIEPEENNYYRVHYILSGPDDTPFEGGLYHGMIKLNDNHPSCAPRIYMFTPNGRFIAESCPEPKNSGGICTTATAYHPDTWTPMNNIGTVLIGFLSLMCEPYDGSSVGGMYSSYDQKKKMAQESLEHLKSDTYVKNLFPELHKRIVDGTYKKPKFSKKSNHENNKSVLKKCNVSSKSGESVEESIILSKKSNKKIKKEKLTKKESSSTESVDSAEKTSKKIKKPKKKNKHLSSSSSTEPIESSKKSDKRINKKEIQSKKKHLDSSGSAEPIESYKTSKKSSKKLNKTKFQKSDTESSSESVESPKKSKKIIHKKKKHLKKPEEITIKKSGKLSGK